MFHQQPIRQVRLTFYLMLFFTSVVVAQSDSVAKITPDDYIVTTKMIAENEKGGTPHGIKVGEVYSLDMVWFTNDTLKQTLAFHLATDYHRVYVYHFSNSDIPEEIKRKILLYTKKEYEFDLATDALRRKYFPGFIDSAVRISQRYFTSVKGLQLGDKKEKALRLYGKPHQVAQVKDIERCEWSFNGDIDESSIRQHGKQSHPLALDSFGYTVTMFFKDGKLLAMMLFNDVP